MSQRLNNELERQHNKKGNTLTLSSKIKVYEKSDEVMTIPVMSRNLFQEGKCQYIKSCTQRAKL
ncbi:hypothetical protein Plhal304r1_c018g0065761 [Plasmopara halstedii]